MKKTGLLATLLLLAIGLGFSVVPAGATVTSGTVVQLGSGTAGTANAWGGNISQVNLTINSSTLHWAAFYGNVTGALRLASVSGSNTSTVKTWSVSTISGQIYASTGTNVDFSSIGGTNITGGNLDTAFSFLSGAADSGTNTVTASLNPAISVGSISIAAGTRPLITTMDWSGNQVWNEVVLTDGTPTTATSVVFAGVLNNTGRAYNNASAHFQIIIPENSAGDTSASSVSFWGELR